MMVAKKIRAGVCPRLLNVTLSLLGVVVFAAFSVKAQQEWAHVCTDGGAGGYEAFPDVCRTADGRLLAVFYAGYGHIALPNEQWPKGGRISACYSSDEGVTWSAPFTLFDGPDDDRDPSVTQLRDGRLACVFFSLTNTPGVQPGYAVTGTFLVTSANNGASWETEPRLISRDYFCTSPIRELSDGRLALGLYTETQQTAYGAVTFSSDGGATWGAPVDIPSGGLYLDAETDVIELKEGRLFAALRGQGLSAWSTSSDRGSTWSVAQQFGFPGHCHYLHRAPGDIILMAFRWHEAGNTSLRYSLDECRTWSDNVVVDNVIGAYPSMVTLKDGSILIVYYEEGEGSNIRAKRFRVKRAGIKPAQSSIGFGNLKSSSAEIEWLKIGE
ncbi:MAG: sialidase family protein [Kiritimatiellae bacterium]|nr:sialidase family protein [Kiritimatiellia bacterium]